MIRILKWTGYLLCILFICSLGYTVSYFSTSFGDLTLPKGIEIGSIVISKNDSPRFTAVHGRETQIDVTIISEKFETSPTLYLPFYQRGKINAQATFSVKINGQFIDSSDVSIEHQQTAYRILPDFFVKDKVRSGIHRAICQKIENRVDEMKRNDKITPNAPSTPLRPMVDFPTRTEPLPATP